MPQTLLDLLSDWRELLERGGPVLVTILLLSIVLWSIICERYWYLYRIYPRWREQLIAEWLRREDRDTVQARRLRDTLIAAAAVALRARLGVVRTLTVVLPLLGLLGTVAGMISTFDVLVVFGTGNLRGFAAGISEALLTTAAGLITALSGLYFSANLEHRAADEARRIANRLSLG